jgi:uncharacterized protein (DUF58 family)
MNLIKNLFLTQRFYIFFSVIIVLLAFSFALQWFFPIAQTLLVLFALATLADIFLLFFQKNNFEIKRMCPQVMSLSDENEIIITIENKSVRDFAFSLIDEIPVIFQKRDLYFEGKISPNETVKLKYSLRPTSRGDYFFGNINFFIKNAIGFAERRIIVAVENSVPVYPSIVQMKKYAIFASENISTQEGAKKMRKLGHSYEFEQIKEYVQGDDYRSINWKASSRRGDLMVNQFVEEKSQQIYCIIDKSRTMRMPFNELSLMDYAINTTLSLSNVALLKQDKAGLITFSDKIGTVIKADKHTTQLHKILKSLYAETDRKAEANYEILYRISQKIIKGRSLVVLFTNFESQYALDRVLQTMRQINRAHLLLVVFFENTEIEEFSSAKAESVEGIYHQTIAKKYLQEKKQMVNMLKQYGIQAILTKPQDLTINTINKYLEMKSRGLI